MAVTLHERIRNTRGLNSRPITYKAVGKYVMVEVEKESKPVLNEDGTPKLDADGNPIREKLGKDANGKLITIKEMVPDFVTAGVLTDMEDALSLVDNDEQVLLDYFVEGFNEAQYAKEAGKDELDDFLKSMSLDEEQEAVFKKTARQLNRGTGLSLLDAAEMIKSMMEQAKAKQAAKA
jgi:hypothetical protein